MRDQLGNRRNGQKPETLVLSRTDDGFRVYSPALPTKSYIVTGSPEAPTCTCPDFQNGDPRQHCKHIRAVLDQFDRSGTTPEEIEERLAIQNEGKGTEEKPIDRNNGGSQMLIKRSVSPDGRIDSLSIECSFPVDDAFVKQIKARAEKTIRLQSEIIGGFLNGSPKENHAARGATTESNGAVAARMLSVGGMDGKWGRRLFINVQVNGRTAKLFGNRKQLAEQVTAAGFPDYADAIEEGATLNLPCRAVTKPSEDGRFLNVERLLPVEPSNGRRAR